MLIWGASSGNTIRVLRYSGLMIDALDDGLQGGVIGAGGGKVLCEAVYSSGVSSPSTVEFLIPGYEASGSLVWLGVWI